MRGTPPGGQGWTRTRHTHDTTTLRHQKLREQLLLVYCSAEATHASNPASVGCTTEQSRQAHHHGRKCTGATNAPQNALSLSQESAYFNMAQTSSKCGTPSMAPYEASVGLLPTALPAKLDMSAAVTLSMPMAMSAGDAYESPNIS